MGGGGGGGGEWGGDWGRGVLRKTEKKAGKILLAAATVSEKKPILDIYQQTDLLPYRQMDRQTLAIRHMHTF